MYKILSLNGGGVKGYLTALLLEEIERRSKKRIKDLFDLIVGTSSGSFLTVMLENLSAEECVYGIREEISPKLFKKNLLSFGGLIDTKYNNQSRIDCIKNSIPSNYNIKSYDYGIVSYDMLARRPVIFNSKEEVDNKNYLFKKPSILADAVIASTAAPIYWDPYTMHHKNDIMLLVDGGMLTSDPTSIAIKLALDDNYSLEDLCVVNVGVGNNTRAYDFISGANPLQWLIPSFNMLMTSQQQLSSMIYSDENLDYYNIDGPLLKASDDIDNISYENFNNLILESKSIIANKDREIDEAVERLLR